MNNITVNLSLTSDTKRLVRKAKTSIKRITTTNDQEEPEELKNVLIA